MSEIEKWIDKLGLEEILKKIEILPKGPSNLTIPAEIIGKRFLKCLEGELVEEFLKILLSLMKVKFMLDPSYRKNIEHFRGRYQFKSRDETITVLVEFDNGKMDIKETLTHDVDVTVIFKDGRALMNFLFHRDILRGLLNNEVNVNGNLNYMYKFGFMANHPLLELTGKLA